MRTHECKVYRRTFEAQSYPEDSQARAQCNESCITSEYMTSHRYAVLSDIVSITFRTKREAQAWADNANKGAGEMRLYYHQTDGGAKYLCSEPVPRTDEGSFSSKYIIRIDGDITKDATLSIRGK